MGCLSYSRDGDQLCSNFAVAFAFLALICGIVPQTTCSYVSTNPTKVVALPSRWAVPNVTGLNETMKERIIDYINENAGDVSIEDIAGVLDDRRLLDVQQHRYLQQRNLVAAQQRQEDDEEEEIKQRGVMPRSLQGGNFFYPEDSLLPRRNITVTNWTANAGPWLFGRAYLDNACLPIKDYQPTFGDPTVLAVRAMGIVASVSGLLGILAALCSCKEDAKTRRRNNRIIALLYGLAFVSTCLTALMFNARMCKGNPVTVTQGPLEGLVVMYGKCQCRAGCIINVFTAICYLLSTITVLQK